MYWVKTSQGLIGKSSSVGRKPSVGPGGHRKSVGKICSVIPDLNKNIYISTPTYCSIDLLST